MTTLWTALVPLVQKAPDPADVKPGWLGLTVFLVLLAAVVFLGFSLRKHLGRVNFEEKPDPKKEGPKPKPSP
jgi:hypothetical protein